MQSVSDVTKRGERLTVLITNGNGVVTTGEFWTGGAGLSIALPRDTGGFWPLVNAAVLALYDVPGMISAELENGWTVMLVREESR